MRLRRRGGYRRKITGAARARPFLRAAKRRHTPQMRPKRGAGAALRCASGWNRGGEGDGFPCLGFWHR